MRKDRRIFMKHELTSQSLKAAPAVGGALTATNEKAQEVVIAAANDMSAAEIAAWATTAYVILQALYLLWKWNNERKDRKST